MRGGSCCGLLLGLRGCFLEVVDCNGDCIDDLCRRGFGDRTGLEDGSEC